MARLISRRHTLGLPLALAASAYIGHSTGAAAATSTTSNDASVPATRFYAGRNGRKGLVVYLDGDGQELYDSDSNNTSSIPGGLAGTDGIVGAATSRGHDVLSVRTPSADGKWWSGDNVKYFADTIQRESTKHRCTMDQLWLIGYSGGSEFITQSFFPEYAESMKGGGFIVFGGGDAPNDQTGISFSPQDRSKFSLNWVTGKQDSSKEYDALGNAKKGLAFYSSAPNVAFNNTWSKWPDNNHENITKHFGLYVGVALDRHKWTSLLAG